MKLAFISGLCVKHDAISASVYDSISVLRRDPANDVRLYAYSCDFANVPFKRVESVADIMLDRFFQDADLVILHFGVFNPLFNVIFLLRDRTPTIVWFHNITPKAFVAPQHHEIIDRSFGQVANMNWASHVVCDSDTNLRVLLDHGVEASATVIPLSVAGLEALLARKPSHGDRRLRLLFIGRFVRSKGCDDLVDGCIAAARRLPGIEIQIDIVGNSRFAEPAILARLRGLATSWPADLPSNLSFRLHESLDEESKVALLKAADLFVLPTYHEGFCVTIVEAITFGCRVVAYANSNVPAITRGMGTLVETGDVRALSDAIVERVEEVASAQWIESGYRAYAAICVEYAKDFSLERLATDMHRMVKRFARHPSASRESERDDLRAA